LIGSIGQQYFEMDVGRFRSAIVALAGILTDRGVKPGSTVCLLPPPRTSEVPTAMAYATLTAMGVRVLLPMCPDPQALERWLEATGVTTVIWNAAELRGAGTESDRMRHEAIAGGLRQRGTSTVCLREDTGPCDPICPRRSLCGGGRRRCAIRSARAASDRWWGHCRFTPGEVQTAFTDLVQWVTTGQKP
jgi:hypothetical protein